MGKKLLCKPSGFAFTIGHKTPKDKATSHLASTNPIKRQHIDLSSKKALKILRFKDTCQKGKIGILYSGLPLTNAENRFLQSRSACVKQRHRACLVKKGALFPKAGVLFF
jgi:hypothetical protein